MCAMVNKLTYIVVGIFPYFYILPSIVNVFVGQYKSDKGHKVVHKSVPEWLTYWLTHSLVSGQQALVSLFMV